MVFFRRFNSLYKKVTVLIMLMLICVFSFIPNNIYALNNGQCGGDLLFSISSGSLIISGNGDMYSYSEDNMPPWYEERDQITSIVIEDGVNSVGTLAFYGLDKLRMVSLGNALKSIGSHAFKDCTSLRFVNFPESLRIIGESAFENCSNMNGVVLNNGLTKIGDFAFYRCSSLSSIVVPETVTDFGVVVFAYCDSLLSCVIKSNIIAIPDWTFYNCSSLNNVSLPKTVESAGESSFHNCNNLSGIYYSGDSKETLISSLDIYDGKGNHVINSDPPSEIVVSKENNNDDLFKEENDSIRTITTENDNIVTVSTHIESTFEVEGDKVTLEEAINAVIENDEINIKEDKKDIVVQTNETTTISSTITDSKDWDDLNEIINDVAKDSSNANKNSNPNNNIITNTDSSTEIEIQLTDSVVTKENLGGTAGKDVVLIIKTNDGDEWMIQQSNKTETDYGKDNYDLDISVETIEDVSNTKIDSDEVYKINFNSDIDFDTTVGINVKVDNSHEYATLYKGSKEISTVIIDGDGYAWFDLSNINKKDDYYIGINVNGVDKSEAVIPHTLKEEFRIDDDSPTLTDASGTKYVVGDRTSRWGITGKQFAIYIAIGVAIIAFIITGVMITLNKISKNKAMYDAKAEKDNREKESNLSKEEIDEIRLKVMQDMLEEDNNKKL